MLLRGQEQQQREGRFWGVNQETNTNMGQRFDPWRGDKEENGLKSDPKSAPNPPKNLKLKGA